jgi:sialate O-acetylesterase
MHRSILLLTLFSFAAVVRGDVVLAPLFTDNAVLQRGKPIPVWGAADPGEEVSVTLGDDTVTTQANTDGRWSVRLKSREATSVPASLAVSGKNRIVLQNILIGEVWLAAGQSNMAFVLSRGQNAAHEIASADYPLIRHFSVPHLISSKPLSIGENGAWPGNKSGKSAWMVATPANAGNFSAVGYFFARELVKELNIPIGIITCARGDTGIESWLDPMQLEADGTTKAIQEQHAKQVTDMPGLKQKYQDELAAWTQEQAAAKAKGGSFTKPKPRAPWPVGSHRLPFGHFNAMIHPTIPYALRGIIWYQGESNVGRPDLYRQRFPALIKSWRQLFGQGELPFYWVQLASFSPDHPRIDLWAYFREVQDQTLSVPNTGQAVAIDIGDAVDIHPKNKQEVGRRLALIALGRDYGKKVDYENPRMISVHVEGALMRVKLAHARGLNANGKSPQSLEIAGVDRKFVPAVADIEGETLIVSAPSVTAPVAVRYAWRSNPSANLYNAAGLPVVPFRSDTWESDLSPSTK